jgi:ETC complex I subunit conserved region
MTARIYQRPKNAMQSGTARTGEWVLEFMSDEKRKADPLMGWAGSGDTQAQVQLSFPTLEAARAYAAKKNISATYIPTPPKTLKLQTYADNFR